MDMFAVILGLLICICFILHIYTRKVEQHIKDPHYRVLEQVYLAVYLLALGNIQQKKYLNVF